MFRDGLSFDEACSSLENDPARRARRAMRSTRSSQALPTGRVARGPSKEAKAPLTGAAGPWSAPSGRRLPIEPSPVIGLTLRELPAQDRIFLRLHLESGFTVAEAARSLGLEQKALYRTKENVLKHLRTDLAAKGIGSEAAHELLADARLGRGAGVPRPGDPSPGRKKADRGRLKGWTRPPGGKVSRDRGPKTCQCGRASRSGLIAAHAERRLTGAERPHGEHLADCPTC